jgi:flagellar L-ring protein precursor FlgH
MNSSLSRFCQCALPVLLAVMLVACSSTSQPIASYAPVTPIQPVLEPPTSGSIYQSGADVRLFEDLKAARVGDILTVRLVEQTAASTSANTSTSRSSSASISNPTIFGRQPTAGGIPLFDGSLGGESEFDGSGASSQSNSLLGDIAVTVVERYPNGNLLIRGEKWVTLNQGREFIQLSGIVRPYDISPDNSIPSTRIADAQISYSGKGVLAAANRMGLFARFFNSMFHGD